jgi:hypothetical protein
VEKRLVLVNPAILYVWVTNFAYYALGGLLTLNTVVLEPPSLRANV